MKKFLTILTSLIVPFSLLVSCAAEDEYSVVGGIYGTVTDAETNQPVQGANVVLSPTNVSTVTGADGIFSFTNLEAQQYKLTVTASGYSYNSRQVTVLAGQNISGDVNLTSTEEIDGFSISKSSLLFGSTYSELTFTITNTGNASETSWEITGVDEQWLSVSPMSGTTAIGKSSSVKVSLNRTYITEDVMSYIIVNAGGGSEDILITASHASTGDGNESDVVDNFSMSTTSLDFDEQYDRLEFTITNTGVEDFDFSIWLVQPEWLLFSWDDTTVAANSSQTVTVTIDRDKLFGQGEVTIEVRTDIGSKYIDITAYEPIDYGTAESPDRTLEAYVYNVETSGTKVYVDFRLINSNDETHSQFRLGEPNTGEQLYAIDDLYNTYEFTNYSNYAINLSINNVTINDAGNVVQNVFSSGGVINGTVVIDGVDSSASKFTTIAIGVYAYGSSNNYHGQITFANVPIIR